MYKKLRVSATNVQVWSSKNHAMFKKLRVSATNVQVTGSRGLEFLGNSATVQANPSFP
jgi:hypothetical protein